MKQIFVTLAFLLGMACFMQAQNTQEVAIENQQSSSQQVKKKVAPQSSSLTVVSDTTDAAMEKMDSIIQAKVNIAVEKKVEKEMRKWKKRYEINSKEFPNSIIKDKDFVGVISIILFFICPLTLIAILLYFRYKSKKAKYEVMKQALAHGKNLPPDFTASEMAAPFARGSNDILWKKGINTFFLGLGLALFLGILADASLASIGILIMCIGAGQIILAWYPTACQVKSSYNKHRQEEKLWEEEREVSRHEEAPQPKKRETERNNSSAYAPKAENTTPEKVRETAETEAFRPQTKQETTAAETSTTTEEQPGNTPSDEENASSDKDKEETKE